MGNSAARNAALVILAMAVGLTLGAATKFGLGYDLAVSGDNHVPKVLAKQ